MKVQVRLEYWRKKRALSMPELASKAHVGLDTIRKIEREGWTPGPKVIRRLAEGLGVTLDELVILEEDESLKIAS